MFCDLGLHLYLFSYHTWSREDPVAFRVCFPTGLPDGSGVPRIQPHMFLMYLGLFNMACLCFETLNAVLSQDMGRWRP